MTEEDKKLLESLGLSDIPEEEKPVILEMIDEKMTKLYIANLLSSLDPARAQELAAEVEKIPSENTEEIISKIIEKHPDAAKILQDSAQQIIEEIKANKNTNPAGAAFSAINTATSQQNNDTPPAPQPTAPHPPVAPEATETTSPSTTPEPRTSEPVSPGLNQATEQLNTESVTGALNENSGTAPISTKEPAPEPVSENATASDQSVLPSAESLPKPETTTETKPLPTPQEELSNPFGDEIKMVQSEEFTQPAPVNNPSENVTQPEEPPASDSSNPDQFQVEAFSPSAADFPAESTPASPTDATTPPPSPAPPTPPVDPVPPAPPTPPAPPVDSTVIQNQASPSSTQAPVDIQSQM